MRILTFLALVGTLVFAALAAEKPAAVEAGSPYLTTFPPTRAVALDPKLKADLEAVARVTPVERMSPAEARSTVSARIAKVPRLNEPVAGVEDRQVPGPAGKVPVRLYIPDGRRPFPVLLYLHGGGWTVGGLDTHDDLCRSLCHRAGCLVVSVAYRLAPEAKFPAAVEDCYTALRWCAAHAGGVGGDPKRLAVAGDSAGGNLTAALALYTRDKGGPTLTQQVLIYPVTNHAFDTASYHQNATGFGLSRERMVWYWNNYLSKPEDGTNPYASPLQAKDLAGLPPALILTAEFDPLRDDGEAYAARLRHAGVAVHCTRYLEMNHGFLHFGAVYDQAKHGLEEVAAALRKAQAK
jgi:acetyl esterase